MQAFRSRWSVAAGAAASLIAVVALLVRLRGTLEQAHIALLLLLVVLCGSAAGGRRIGFALAGASFIAFNWLFLPPYGTLHIANPLDWLVLAVFLATSVVAAQLLHRAQAESRARAQAAEMDRLKDSLLASVSHDLRTPLTTIKALAQDLRTLGDERVEIIEQECDRLNRTVTDLLDLSRLSAGVLTVRPELNAVEDLLGALVQRVELTLGDGRLDVTLPADEPLLLGRFDLVHSLRVLQNLVENAARYSPSGATVEVEAARDGNDVVIEVRDHGPGIPAGEAARVFESFYRPEGSVSDAGRAGLGLAISRQLAEAQGGLLAYAPRAGGGSVFTLRLPAADLIDARHADSAPGENDPGARARTSFES